MSPKRKMNLKIKINPTNKTNKNNKTNEMSLIKRKNTKNQKKVITCSLKFMDTAGHNNSALSTLVTYLNSICVNVKKIAIKT